MPFNRSHASMLLVLGALTLTVANAQDTPNPAAHSATCKPNPAEPTGADIAYARGEYKKASELYTALSQT